MVARQTDGGKIEMAKQVVDRGIGWTEADDIELSDEHLAQEDKTADNFVGCCQTDFHVIEDEAMFQDFLNFLHTPKVDA